MIAKFSASLFVLLAATAASAAPRVTMTRLDCGTEPPRPRSFFSDTFSFDDQPIVLADSCYLIQHGEEYLLWEAGSSLGIPSAPSRTLPQLLGELGLAVDRIRFLGISHFHSDHIGQAAAFKNATLLIGKADWDVLSAPRPPADRAGDQQGFERWRAPFKSWIGGGQVKPLTGDEDVFGDGTVMMLAMPGHTPGHYVLLVRLQRTGAVLLSGDLAHFHENYEDDGVPPTWGFNRADSLASLARFKRIASRLRATVIIQHDRRDIEKLPAFPAAAE
jgi:N-acyl homoserine lactone hydrolase